MCYSVHKLTTIMKLCMAAQGVQQLVDDGTLAECFGRNKNGEAHKCVAAFNLLQESAAAVTDERKDVSPFLRYRSDIMAPGPMAERTRSVVMNLWSGRQCNLSALFMNADPHFTRIALECIASYANHGENDRHFMAVADMINELETEEARS